jgi:hypothetical protein
MKEVLKEAGEFCPSKGQSCLTPLFILREELINATVNF